MHTYTIATPASLTGITTRTLHYYGHIGLLSPTRDAHNDYRLYTRSELLRLQQILFYKALDFSLDEIKQLLDAPDYDILEALRSQREALLAKQGTLTQLLATIDATITSLTTHLPMDDKDLFEHLDAHDRTYKDEAAQRWGHTDAYKESQERVQKMGKEGLAQVMQQQAALTQELAEACKNNLLVESDDIQALFQQHYDQLRNFYEPTLELYEGLAEMYIADERFAAHYEGYAPGLAQYMHDGMKVFVENHST